MEYTLSDTTTKYLTYHVTSASHLATLQGVVYHLLRVHCYDDRFHHQCGPLRVANSWLELGFNHPPFARRWMPHPPARM